VSNPTEDEFASGANAAARLTAIEERLSRIESVSPDELETYKAAISDYRARLDEWQRRAKGNAILRVIAVVLLLYIAYRVS
jgi:hypothetical protein